MQVLAAGSDDAFLPGTKDDLQLLNAVAEPFKVSLDVLTQAIGKSGGDAPGALLQTLASSGKVIYNAAVDALEAREGEKEVNEQTEVCKADLEYIEKHIAGDDGEQAMERIMVMRENLAAAKALVADVPEGMREIAMGSGLELQKGLDAIVKSEVLVPLAIRLQDHLNNWVDCVSKGTVCKPLEFLPGGKENIEAVLSADQQDKFKQLCKAADAIKMGVETTTALVAKTGTHGPKDVLNVVDTIKQHIIDAKEVFKKEYGVTAIRADVMDVLKKFAGSSLGTHLEENKKIFATIALAHLQDTSSTLWSTVHNQKIAASATEVSRTATGMDAQVDGALKMVTILKDYCVVDICYRQVIQHKPKLGRSAKTVALFDNTVNLNIGKLVRALKAVEGVDVAPAIAWAVETAEEGSDKNAVFKRIEDFSKDAGKILDERTAAIEEHMLKEIKVCADVFAKLPKVVDGDTDSESAFVKAMMDANTSAVSTKAQDAFRKSKEAMKSMDVEKMHEQSYTKCKTQLAGFNVTSAIFAAYALLANKGIFSTGTAKQKVLLQQLQNTFDIIKNEKMSVEKKLFDRIEAVLK